jgi:hypothetical protein
MKIEISHQSSSHRTLPHKETTMKDKTTYQQPKPTPVPDFAGYPEKVANTQTNKMKGSGAATKGTGFSKRTA